ncbi:membrane protein involved in aromatic hydrocarbon degradation, partial [gut metagenome]
FADTEYYIKENSVNPEQFDTRFNGLRYENRLGVSGVGVYGKFGILVTPGAGFRLGAAIQTPTILDISENWSANAEQHVNANPANKKSGNAATPDFSYNYRLRTPMSFNVGAAWTFSKFGLISLDYEMCNYKSMMFKSRGITQDEFDYVNGEIKEFMGTSHELRAGLEIKPVESFAIRLGYNYTTSP